jgi:hypothetical protein
MNTGNKMNVGFKSMDVFGSTIFAANIYEGLFRSLDNGNTWTSDSSFFYIRNTADVQRILLCGKALFAATTFGAFRSLDGGDTWNGANTGIASFPASSIIEAGSSLILSSTTSIIFLSKDNGALWLRLKDGIDQTVSALGQWKDI